METHKLKTYPQYFQQTWNGNKLFEARLNDRNYKIGDIVILKEWDNIKYSGREIEGKIKYILDDKFIGLTEGYVVFSFEEISRREIKYAGNNWENNWEVENDTEKRILKNR